MTEHNLNASTRGPTDHAIRDQIVDAATGHFTHYGYEKTTVSDLARAVGFSKAYIYKFFKSKQEIGEVICSNRLAMIMHRVEEALSESPSASDKIRRLFRTVAASGTELFFHDRKLYDIAAVASRDDWPAAQNHKEQLHQLVKTIIRQGREAGEFERKTPLDETASAVWLVLRPFVDPVQLQSGLENADESAHQLASLVLRSLSP